jgi:periplasmic protein CpxP/Spy
MSKWLNVATKVFVAALVIGFCSSTLMAAAGDANKPKVAPPARDRETVMKDRVDAQLKNLTAKLELTEKQQADIKPILENQQKQMSELMGSPQMSREERRAKMQENREKVQQLRKETNEKIEQLLTPEQKEKFKKMTEEQGQRMARPGARPGQPGGPNTPPVKGDTTK